MGKGRKVCQKPVGSLKGLRLQNRYCSGHCKGRIRSRKNTWEDLTGFVKKIVDSGIRDEEDIRHELKQQYNIKVNIAAVREVLSEVKRPVAAGKS